jgi:hypothetical protein
MVNGSGRKLVQTRHRVSAPLILQACSTYATTEHRRHLHYPPR